MYIEKLDPWINPNPICTNSTNAYTTDFLYFDKDGFELTKAEQKYYKANSLPVNDCLNHSCYQEPWLEITADNVFLDHCTVLHRARFDGEALTHLHYIKDKVGIPTASYLINCKQKWGFDFALDGIDSNGDCFEVIHLEYDSRDFDKFCEQLDTTEKQIYNIDWPDAARRVEQLKDKWQHLKGFEQNHWKAEFLMNWSRAEYLEKTT